MTYEELLKSAKFNDVEQGRLISLSYRFPMMKDYAEKFMSGDRSLESFKATVALIEPHKTEEASLWALHMVFLCHAFALLWDSYEEKGLSRRMFDETANDLTCKVRECVLVNGDIGTVSVEWFWEFLAMKRFSFGRLQFGCNRVYPFETYTKNGYTVEKDTPVIDCHIPSGGPLTQEMCFDSYRRVWEFWHHLFDDGVIRVICGTHLFYPPYRELYGENTRLFAENFEVVTVKEYDAFHDSWRFFDTGDTSDLDRLPTRTSLQRRFIEYMKNGGTHGLSYGVMLFDGEKIVNK